jgi:hypothetical protein
MALVYRLLGMVAALNKGLSGWRLTLGFWGVPIAPFHLLLLIGMVVATWYGALYVRDGLLNDQTPLSLPFKEVPGRADLTNRYVSVAGWLAPQASQTFLTKSRSGQETVDAVYVPFGSDDQADPVLLVKYPQSMTQKAVHLATITGMLRAPDSRLQESAAQIKARFAPTKLDLTNVLVADESPANPWLFGPLVIASILFCGMLIYTYFTGWSVYRRLGRNRPGIAQAPPEGEASPFLDLQVSGTFTEHGGSLRYLHDAPSRLVLTVTGELALETQFVTDHGAATCSIVLQLATITSWDVGWLYFGFTVRPAVRLRFVDSNTRRRAVIFVKFPNEEHRQTFLAQVNGTSGYRLD